MSDKLLDLLWQEKFRPKSLDELVVDDSIKRQIKEFTTAGEIPHILLIGTAGIGKTSLAKILVEDILDCEYLALNGSDEGGIDTVRTKVKGFASSATFDRKKKVIIFGEADGLTKAAQNSLKEIIEDYSETTRFIFTANDESKLSAPIISRCQKINLFCKYEPFKDHCVSILEKEGVDYDLESVEKCIKPCFPDFRKALVDMRASISEGVFTFNPKQVNKKFPQLVWMMLEREKSPETIREVCIQQSAEYGAHVELMVDLTHVAVKKYPAAISRVILLLMNKYMVQDSQVYDKEINFACLLIDLSKLELK